MLIFPTVQYCVLLLYISLSHKHLMYRFIGKKICWKNAKFRCNLINSAVQEPEVGFTDLSKLAIKGIVSRKFAMLLLVPLES
jgi:hypothetical protein